LAIAATAAYSKRGEGNKPDMGILSWLIVGLIAGFLAKYVVPGEGPGGIVGDIIIGIIGAFIGGWVFHQFGEPGVNGLTLWSILVAFVGAAILLFIMRAITGRRTTY
ncbi:MAG TPA: GlsB/YeaQ/YmgE family stress response membrane protein, partial [Dongiaceae bacterium]|nr:GlsB/YeaQ/YmgE family stress response membrane protein [Dongiaceae bacterium]